MVETSQPAASARNGSLRPVIDKVFPLEQVREALAYSEAGHATGKVVVEVKAAG